MTVTPHVIAGYAKNLYVKDTEGKFASNKYKFEVRMPKGDEAVEAFVEGILKRHEDAGGNQYKPVKDGDNLTSKNENRLAFGKGHYLMTFKSDNPPSLVDAKKKALAETKISGGDVVRVAFSAKPYDAFGGGLALYLNAVMLIEKSAGLGAAEFDEEDGFEETEAETGADKAADDDGDF